MNYCLAKEITQKLMTKCCFLVLKLNLRISQEINMLVNEVKGYTALKQKIFDQFKLLGFQRSERNKVAKSALKHMKRWKIYMVFKSWQHVKLYQQKREEKEQKAIEVLRQRRLYRLFNYFKIGVVYNRISYLDSQITDIVYTNSMKFKILIEWCRRVHVDKSIKTKVIQMLNKTNSKMTNKFNNMNKIQIDEYFSNLRSQGLERLSEELISLKMERNHYKTFIKKEIQLINTKINGKYPLKLILITKSFFDMHIKEKNLDNSTFSAVRDHLFQTPEKNLQQKCIKQYPHNKFVELLKSHNRRNS